MRKILSWIVLILWMALIFFFSSQVAEQSEQLSDGITEKIVAVMVKVNPNAKIAVEKISFFVRKNAHFLVFLVLGVLTVNALRCSGVGGYRGILAAIAVCVFYAITDEIHQLFVPGRSCQFTDVLIDSAGATVGAFIFGMILKKKKATKENMK